MLNRLQRAAASHLLMLEAVGREALRRGYEPLTDGTSAHGFVDVPSSCRMRN